MFVLNQFDFHIPILISFSSFHINPSALFNILSCRVIAVNDIEEGKIVMTINRSAILSAKFGCGPNPMISNLLSKFADNATLELSVVLLYHRSIKDSYFKPYINSLPSYYSVPSFWDFEIFKTFENSSTLKRFIGSLRSR